MSLSIFIYFQMDKFINRDYLQLYSLLAGTLVWRSSEEVINTCAGLDWKRCLALHLWLVLLHFLCFSCAMCREWEFTPKCF